MRGGSESISLLSDEKSDAMTDARPMLIGAFVGAVTVISALLFSPETKGKVFVADLMSDGAECQSIVLRPEYVTMKPLRPSPSARQ